MSPFFVLRLSLERNWNNHPNRLVILILVLLMNGIRWEKCMRASTGESEYSVCDLGVLDAPTVDVIVKDFVEKRQQDMISDLLLFLSYRPCLTVGARQLDENDFLMPHHYFTDRGVPLYKTERGGGLTYHWPGQLVSYPILTLQAHEQNIPSYMQKLEEIGLRTLADLGVFAHRKRDKTAQIGLWVGSDKIASMGIRISRWVTSYGFALNLSGDVSVSRHIRPCGLKVKLTTVEKQIGQAPNREEVKEKMSNYFEFFFQRQPRIDEQYDKQIQDIVNGYGDADIGGNVNS